MEELLQQIRELSKKIDVFEEKVLDKLDKLDEKVELLCSQIPQNTPKRYEECACCYNLHPCDEETRYCPGCGYYYCRFHWDSNESHFLGGDCNLSLHPNWEDASPYSTD